MIRFKIGLFALFLIFTVFSASQAKPVIIKFATLAPDGTAWMKLMREFADTIKTKTNGEVVFKIYPGGIQGDEKDVLRKIRINQLQGGGFTGLGMGVILPEVRILDTPFLFRNKDEVDFIINKFSDYFASNFEKKGFVLLGWAEVGYVYIYTKKFIRSPDEFKTLKMWMWEGDPVAEATFKAFGLNPIPLSITDVLTSLQTGLIDAVYTSPMACIALQWFTKVNYIIDVPLTNSTGAVLISKRAFKKIKPEYQTLLKEKGFAFFRKLTEISRSDNSESLKMMRKNGLKILPLGSPENLVKFQEMGDKARMELLGKLYDRELLDKIQTALREYRKQASKETE